MFSPLNVSVSEINYYVGISGSSIDYVLETFKMSPPTNLCQILSYKLEIEPSSLLTEFHESMFVPISTSNVKALIKLFVISNCSSHELDVSEIATELHAKCPYSATFSLSCDVATADPFNVLNEVCLHAGNLNKKAGRKIPSYEPSN